MSDAGVEQSRVKTPMRPRRERRVTTSGFTWLPAEQVPGAVLPASAQRELQEKLRRLDEWVGRSRVSARNYWIGGGR